MSFFRDLSIRNKLGLLLASVSVIFLLTYSYIVLNNFQKDKLAYVYDSSLAFSKASSDQIQLVFSQALDHANFFTSQYSENAGFSPVAKQMFQSEKVIEAFYVLPQGMAPDQVTKNQQLAQTPELAKIEDYAVKYISNLNADTKFDILIEPSKLDSWYIVIPHQGSLQHYKIILKLSQARLLKALNGNNLQDIYLADQKGRIYFSPLTPVQPINQEQIRSVITKTTFSSSGQQMSEEKISGSSYLFAITKVGLNDLILVSPISKAMAMESLYIIIAKSVVFLVLFLALTVVISVIAPSRITQGLLQLFQATKEIEKGNFSIEVVPQSNDEVGGLTKSFNHMTKEIQRLIAETAEKARMANELKTAKTVQETLLPGSNLTTDSITIHGFYESASECGGDWWHHSRQDNKTYIWIGDVTGHGAPAALVTSAAKAVSSVCQEYPDLEVNEIVAMMNRAIYATTNGKLMMTFFLGCMDETNQKFTYCIASHEPPIVLPSNVAELKANDLPTLGENTGPRLGHKPDSKYILNEFKLSAGDKVFLYTDGVTDLQNPEGKQFGEMNLTRTLIKLAKAEPRPEKFYEDIKQVLTAHRKDSALVDDVTFVVFDKIK